MLVQNIVSSKPLYFKNNNKKSFVTYKNEWLFNQKNRPTNNLTYIREQRLKRKNIDNGIFFHQII